MWQILYAGCPPMANAPRQPSSSLRCESRAGSCRDEHALPASSAKFEKPTGPLDHLDIVPILGWLCGWSSGPVAQKERGLFVAEGEPPKKIPSAPWSPATKKKISELKTKIHSA